MVEEQKAKLRLEIAHVLFLSYKDDPRFAALCRKVGSSTPAEVAAASQAMSNKPSFLAK